jgi:hypothetical protein
MNSYIIFQKLYLFAYSVNMGKVEPMYSKDSEFNGENVTKVVKHRKCDILCVWVIWIKYYKLINRYIEANMAVVQNSIKNLEENSEVA